jgi:uncharacterized alkaline shock family protein YloU/uncharacterized membrane protein
MKIKPIDRVISIVLAIIIVIVAIAIALIGFNVISEPVMQGVIGVVYSTSINGVILAAIGIVLLLLALRLIFTGEKRPGMPASALIKVTDIGITEISFAGIDSMVQKHCRANARIRECISSIRAVEGSRDSVSIMLRLSLMPESNVPELTSELQKSLKQYVEDYSGINVVEVRVLVESVSINLKTRVD